MSLAGVLSALSVVVRSVPCLCSTCRTERCPYLAAQCAGVSPLLSRHPSSVGGPRQEHLYSLGVAAEGQLVQPRLPLRLSVNLKVPAVLGQEQVTHRLRRHGQDVLVEVLQRAPAPHELRVTPRCGRPCGGRGAVHAVPFAAAAAATVGARLKDESVVAAGGEIHVGDAGAPRGPCGCLGVAAEVAQTPEGAVCRDFVCTENKVHVELHGGCRGLADLRQRSGGEKMLKTKFLSCAEGWKEVGGGGEVGTPLSVRRGVLKEGGEGRWGGWFRQGSVGSWSPRLCFGVCFTTLVRGVFSVVVSCRQVVLVAEN